MSEDSPAHAVLGRTLARLRAEAHLTQERVAELAGIDTRSLQRVEAGEWNISVDYLDKLRWALGCKWADLISDLKE
ncbi:MAG: helix-turn-helix transcriptional regulator [Chthoniobacteraceae bacterium]|nr:helix-turn-helix transcriptional regulator [Chthoniobacteraceae bacterium]